MNASVWVLLRASTRRESLVEKLNQKIVNYALVWHRRNHAVNARHTLGHRGWIRPVHTHAVGNIADELCRFADVVRENGAVDGRRSGRLPIRHTSKIKTLNL
jgi:hypothetical protein